MIKGNLYLIPTFISDGNVDLTIPGGTLTVIRMLDHFIVEEIRSARRFLIKAGISKPIDDLIFFVFNEHSKEAVPFEFLVCTLEGKHVGLLSEAGVPCVADPGSLIVRTAHELGIRVIPLTGPSSILLALMASGFNGQNFCFLGYVPADKSLRIKKIRELERTAREKDQTQIFIETPYRNLQLFESLISVCREDTQLCIASSVTGPDEHIESKPIAAWRKTKPDINKKPAIFLLYY